MAHGAMNEGKEPADFLIENAEDENLRKPRTKAPRLWRPSLTPVACSALCPHRRCDDSLFAWGCRQNWLRFLVGHGSGLVTNHLSYWFR
jgi:hypothetical protein